MHPTEEPHLPHGVADVELRAHPPNDPRRTTDFTINPKTVTDNLEANSSDILSQYNGFGGVAAALPTHLNNCIVGNDDAFNDIATIHDAKCSPTQLNNCIVGNDDAVNDVATIHDAESSDSLSQYRGLGGGLGSDLEGGLGGLGDRLGGVAADLRTHLEIDIVGDEHAVEDVDLTIHGAKSSPTQLNNCVVGNDDAVNDVTTIHDAKSSDSLSQYGGLGGGLRSDLEGGLGGLGYRLGGVAAALRTHLEIGIVGDEHAVEDVDLTIHDAKSSDSLCQYGGLGGGLGPDLEGGLGGLGDRLGGVAAARRTHLEIDIVGDEHAVEDVDLTIHDTKSSDSLSQYRGLGGGLGSDLEGGLGGLGDRLGGVAADLRTHLEIDIVGDEHAVEDVDLTIHDTKSSDSLSQYGGLGGGLGSDLEGGLGGLGDRLGGVAAALRTHLEIGIVGDEHAVEDVDLTIHDTKSSPTQLNNCIVGNDDAVNDVTTIHDAKSSDSLSQYGGVGGGLGSDLGGGLGGLGDRLGGVAAALRTHLEIDIVGDEHAVEDLDLTIHDAKSSDSLSQYCGLGGGLGSDLEGGLGGLGDRLGGVAAALRTHLEIDIVGDEHAVDEVELRAHPLSHPTRPTEFSLDPKTLAEIVDANSSDYLSQYAGLGGMAAALRTHLDNGIVGDVDDLRLRKAAFGSNQFPAFDPTRILSNFLKETCTILLLSAATLSVVLGMVEQGFKTGWCDGVTVFFVVLISGFIKLKKERNQFRKLTANNNFDVSVVRDGQRQKFPPTEIVVGDVVILGPGDSVPADGLFISGHPSFRLGGNQQVGMDRSRFPALRRGEEVLDGDCRVLVLSMGDKTMLMTGADHEQKSPSLVEVDRLLATIEKVVLGLSVVILVVQLLIYFFGKSTVKIDEMSYKDATKSSTEELLNEAAKVIRKNSGIASRLLATFGILFMRVREGGHLGVSICFLLWKKKLKTCAEANVVNLQACSSIGLVTNIYSSETVDLTLEQSKMAELWIGETMIQNNVVSAGVADNVLCSLREGVGLNASSHVDDALLSCAKVVLGVRVEELEQSCSIVCRENMGIDISLWGLWLRRNAEKSVVHIHYRGPPTTILSMCTDYYDIVGERHPLDAEKRDAFEKICERIAAEDYLDCIAFAYKQHEEEDEGANDFGVVEGSLDRGCGGTQRGEGGEIGADDEEHPKHGKREMTLLALVALKNPYTKELKQSFEACQNAGINVTLLLNIDMSIARLIGRSAGLIHAADDTSNSIVEAHEIRESPLTKKIDDIRILANSSPSDKLLLVQSQRERGKVVAFAGNNSTELPSLTEANVGFWVGEGREERADIVISNKTFVSLSAALQRGRFIRSNIQKFVQVHLTAIIVGTAVNFGTAFPSLDTLISAVQFLWVSLLVDILGALALATDPNSGTEFSLPPQSSGLVATKAVWRNVGVQALYQTSVILALQFRGKTIMDVDNSAMDFVVFNTYFLCQVSTLINARQVERSNFSGKIYKNWMFMGLVGLMVALQLGVVEILLAFRHQQRLVSRMWLVPAAVAGLSLPLGYVAKRIPVC